MVVIAGQQAIHILNRVFVTGFHYEHFTGILLYTSSAFDVAKAVAKVTQDYGCLE